MKTLKRLTRGTKDAFWDVVYDCLVDLHQIPSQDARMLCNDRRAEVEFVRKDLKSNIFYHKEPFDVSCELVGRRQRRSYSTPCSLSDPKVKTAYEAILTRHNLM